MVLGTPIVLNLIPSGARAVAHVNEIDQGAELQFAIYNGNAAYNVPEGVTATVRGTKGDGFGYAAAAAVTVGSNIITVTLDEQMTAVAGVNNVFELVLANSNGFRAGTSNFILDVERAALNENTVISDSDIAYAEQVLNDLQSVQAVNTQVQQNKAGLAAEISNRQAAVSAEASARQSADQTLQQNINAEAAARQAADNTLQSNINAEASSRATTDASLQSQIDQLVAPSGEAPSAAEVQNARIGSDGTVYPSLGDAIRTQNSLLKSHLEKTSGNTIGVFAPGYVNVPAIGSTTTLTRTASSTVTSAIVEIQPAVDKVAHIKAIGGGTVSTGPRVVGILDENYTVLLQAGRNVTIDTVFDLQRYPTAKYLIINNVTASEPDPYVIVRKYDRENLDDAESDITGKDALRTIGYEYLQWAEGRILGSSGNPNTSQNTNMYRPGFVDENIHRISAPYACLSAFLYRVPGEYIGAWVAGSNTVVKATTGFSKLQSIDFDLIRETFPGCKIIVQSNSTEIGVNVTYPKEHFLIEYNDFDSLSKLQKGIYTKEPLNLADWFYGAIRYDTGVVEWSDDNITTVDYVPDDWHKIVMPTNGFLRFGAYDTDGVFQGCYSYSSGFVNTSGDSVYFKEIDIDLFREKYPAYRFKLTLYGHGYVDLTNTGYIVKNTRIKVAKTISESSYIIPTRFERERFYTEDRSESGYRCSVQGLCTDGTYLYVAALRQNASNGVTLLRKIDLTGNLVTSNEVSDLGHANDLEYDRTNGVIISTGTRSNNLLLPKIDPDTLTVVGYLDMTQLAAKASQFTGVEITQFNAIAYYEPADVFMFWANVGVTLVTDATFSHIIRVIRYPYVDGSLGQCLYLHNDYILRPYAGTLSDNVLVYDWHGNEITRFRNPVGHGMSYSELEGICEINGDWYTSWNSAENAIVIAKETPIGYETIPVSKVMKGFNYNG